jgi:transposase
MRKRMPTIAESADALHQRMKNEHDVKKRQRLQALYMVASGHARHRQDIAALLGVHRHSVAAWLDAYGEGGLDAMLHYQVPQPPSRQRITPIALTALQAQLQVPHGFAGYTQIRTWLAEQHQVYLSYSGVYALVRGNYGRSRNAPGPPTQKKS